MARTKYLVEKVAQLKFVLLIVVAFLVLLIFLLWNVYNLLITTMPSGILLASKRHIIIFAIGTAVIMAITAIIIIRYTHRFFGPIPRLRRQMNTMAEKNEFHLLTVRDNDFLKEFVDSINLVIKKFMDTKNEKNK